jgi:3-isopropylmalate/(R)-2-methylmalate dehydratase small subunit
LIVQQFTIHTGTGMPLRRSNVDTDQIIPVAYLKRVSRTGFEDGLFASWRQDPGFVLNRSEYRKASILIAGADFGTGSSREHAVWALQDFGFKVVLSPRFADIFRGNSLKNGLLTAELESEAIEELQAAAERDPTGSITVDLEQCVVSWAGNSARFDLAARDRRRLLEGLDEIDLTLEHLPQIEEYERHRDSELPSCLPV